MSSTSLSLSETVRVSSLLVVLALVAGCVAEGQDGSTAGADLTTCADPRSLSCHPPPPVDPHAASLVGSYVIVSTSPAAKTLEELTLTDQGTYSATFHTAFVVAPPCPAEGDCDILHEEGTYTAAEGKLVLTSNTGSVHGYEAERSASQLTLRFGPDMATTLRAAQWGGQHLSVRLTRSGGRLDFDCALGGFDAPLVTDGAGRFRVPGTFVPGSGIALPPGHEPEVHRVVYEGTIAGAVMSLEFSVANGPKRNFVLGAGEDGVVFHCL